MFEYLRFFRGERKTKHGDLSIEDLIDSSDKQLRDGHDYIQWIFPNETLSEVRPDAVYASITQEELLAIQNDPMAMKNIMRMTFRMLEFWGLGCNKDKPFILKKAAFKKSVACAGDHNQLRMTRMLVFMGLIQKTTLLNEMKAFLHDNVNRRQKAQRFWQIV